MGTGSLHLALSSSPGTSSAAQRGLWVDDLHRTELCHFSSQQQGRLHSLHGASALLLPISLTHLAASLSCPPCQIICWSQVNTAEQLQLEFPLHQVTNLPVTNLPSNKYGLPISLWNIFQKVEITPEITIENLIWTETRNNSTIGYKNFFLAMQGKVTVIWSTQNMRFLIWVTESCRLHSYLSECRLLDFGRRQIELMPLVQAVVMVNGCSVSQHGSHSHSVLKQLWGCRKRTMVHHPNCRDISPSFPTAVPSGPQSLWSVPRCMTNTGKTSVNQVKRYFLKAELSKCPESLDTMITMDHCYYA